MKAPILSLCLACIVLGSCSKKTSETAQPLTKSKLQLLTLAPWKETTLEYENQDGTWTPKPLSADLQSYSNVFYDNGTYTVYTNSHTIIANGTWVIIGDDTQLALNLNITYDFSILNETTMQLTLNAQIPYTDPSTNLTYNYFGMRETYVH